ncbi:MAG TPA: tRNA epoxyqueuosine(34) reductase QueG, partial [Polyangia bacterium]|nr:tRNA epoxyqueuosine(34) reductase QueG [Polyangia bacterium]
NRSLGSYFFLGALLLNVSLPPDAPTTAHCGRCDRCLSACPTGAFVAPYVLDARRCISYLTIELDGPIPRELRPLIHDWIFGCDLCQEVCPFNAAAPGADLVPLDLRPRPRQSRPSLTGLLGLGTAQFRKFVDGTALRRVRRRQLLRNVCVALGNVGGPAEVPALARALSDRAPLVRGHAAWALGRLHARAPLEAALAREPDPTVRAEIAAALDEAPRPHYISSR